MTTRMKDRIISGLISTASAVIAVVIAFKMSTKDLNARDIKQQIDKKVDKTEFVEYKNDHKKEHDKDREDMKYIRDKVDKIFEYLIENK